jgi:hypothetical protein
VSIANGYRLVFQKPTDNEVVTQILTFREQDADRRLPILLQEIEDILLEAREFDAIRNMMAREADRERVEKGFKGGLNARGQRVSKTTSG